MDVYVLTDLGKRLVHDSRGGAAVLRVLEFLETNRTATADELEVAGDRRLIRRMARNNFIKKVNV